MTVLAGRARADATSTAAAETSLSAAAERYRSHLGLTLGILPASDGARSLAERAARLGARIARWEGDTRESGDSPALWNREELPDLRRLGPAALAAEWRKRLRGRSDWSDATATLRLDRDFAAAWSCLPSGDFGEAGRGVDYTAGISCFHAARWCGSEILLRLLGALGPRARRGPFLDVLGGDGYLWRVLRGLAALDGAAAGCLVTNDCSRHMFLQAGVWGFPSLEEATLLSRSFRPGSFDGVLFAYGTHHVERLDVAVAEAARLLRPDGVVVLHDFLDEGPAGAWFHHVVDPYSKTGHDLPHVGPLWMAVTLLLAGLRDVELFEMSDPFVFVADDGRAADVLALEYLTGMYGLRDGEAGDPGVLEALVRDHLSYPELGELPSFSAEVAYVPRRAVAARARRAGEPEEPLDRADRELADRLRELLTTPPSRLAAEPEVARWWFGRDRQWGVDASLRRRFLDWADR